jgi:hypothetical protein
MYEGEQPTNTVRNSDGNLYYDPPRLEELGEIAELTSYSVSVRV